MERDERGQWCAALWSSLGDTLCFDVGDGRTMAIRRPFNSELPSCGFDELTSDSAGDK